MGAVVIGMDPHKRSATIEVMAEDELRDLTAPRRPLSPEGPDPDRSPLEALDDRYRS